MSRVHINNYTTTLATAISDVATSMTVTVATGLPALTTGDTLYLTISSFGDYEIVKATARSGSVLTIERAQEGTTAIDWMQGVAVTCRCTSDSLDGKQPKGDGTTLTIASGAIVAKTGWHLVDTQSAAATDDLDTISNGATGQVLTLTAASSARDVVVKDGTGNLKLAGDCTLDNVEDTITLLYNGTNWLEIARSNNGA